MGQWSLFDTPTAIPFHLRGFDGRIAVYYGANSDAASAGFDFLAGLNFNTDLCSGYPAIHARIAEYGGSGYRTVMAWIQLVSRVDQDSTDLRLAKSITSVSVDLAPAFQQLNLPFVCFGNLPQFFDAPCMNLNQSARLVWTADTFLVTTPLRSRDEPIERLAGFRWGYIETNTPRQRPTLLPLEITEAEAWNAHLPFLRETYQDWAFQDA